MNIKRIFTILFATVFLASCSPTAGTVQTEIGMSTSTPAPTETAVSISTSTPAFTSTVMPIPATSTSEVPPQPTVDVRLSAANNAEMVFENNAWVVKNANGDVTATWDGTEWAYSMEVITVSRTIIGFDGQDVHLLDTLLATPLPADTPEKHFSDPISGEPLPYGYVREEKITAVSTEEQTYEIPISMFAVRMLGTVNVNEANTAVVLEMPVTPDRSIIFTFNEYVEQGTTLYKLSNDNLSQPTSLLELPAVLFQSTTNSGLFNADLRGQQILIAIYHDIPTVLSETYAQWNINDDCEALLQFIQDPSAPVPGIDVFGSVAKMSPFWNGALWVPASVVETLQTQ